MATMDDIRKAMELANAAVVEAAKVKAAADKGLADAREALRSEVTAQEAIQVGRRTNVETAIGKALASVKSDVDTLTAHYGSFWLRVESVKLDDGSKSLAYAWPKVQGLDMGAGIPKTPRASGGARTTHEFESLDRTAPRTKCPLVGADKYGRWLGVKLDAAFAQVASAEQVVECKTLDGNTSYEYKTMRVEQAVASGTLVPII